MCGILGFITHRRFNELRQDLPLAASSLTHRGPDDSGLFFEASDGVGLGHRRLSIIDLSSAGRQPMESDDGKLNIVYNGEVYNFKALRKESGLLYPYSLIRPAGNRKNQLCIQPEKKSQRSGL